MNRLLELKRNGWIWQITLLSVVLGMLLAAALKTQQHIKFQSGIPTTRVSGLAQALLDEKENNKRLHTEIEDLRTKINKYEQSQGQGSTQTDLLRNELKSGKFLAGLSPAEGPGVEVTLQDSSKRPAPDAEPLLQQEYIIHDLDLRNFVNELLANGAEALSIKDKDSNQRIIANTSIRCVGGVIRVNGVAMAPPFTICAIGPPDVLYSALRMPQGIIEQFRAINGLSGRMVQVKKLDRMVIPAYSGSTQLLYAVPVDSEGKR